VGFAVEGHSPEVCQGYVDRSLRLEVPAPVGRAGFAFGQYTDDSQLARELLQSYVRRGRFDPADYACAIRDIFAEERIVGRGRATEQGAEALARGVPWDRSGTPPPSAGNGSAMRAGPIGLMFHDDLDALAKAAHDQGRITHADPRCSAGAVVIAGAVARVVRGELLPRADFLEGLAALAAPHDPIMAEALGHMNTWVTQAPDEVAGVVAHLGVNPDYSDGWRGISPFVTSSVLWAVYAFLRSPGDYWETLCTAIAVGGDVDTTAAMAGAISGAHLGLEALPSALTRALNDQQTWGHGALVQLAHDAHAVQVRGGPTQG
jgi:ADP-ribosylglycohydrolase